MPYQKEYPIYAKKLYVHMFDMVDSAFSCIRALIIC